MHVHLNLAALVLAGLTACASLPSDPHVRALRYRQLWTQSAFELAHGLGSVQDFLYLPDAGINCWVRWESEGIFGIELPRMRARHEKFDEVMAARPVGLAQEAPAEIEIPTDLARHIVRLADLAREEQELGKQLGRRAIDERAVGDRSSEQPMSLHEARKPR